MASGAHVPVEAKDGPRDELGLSPLARTVLAARYLRRDAEGRVVESTGEMFDRVAGHVAAAEDAYCTGSSGRWAEAFARMMRAREFLPNSPTLMNAGSPLGVLAGCFVLPVDDSLRSIFTTLRTAALIHQAGAGTGFSFSAVRPRGDVVASSGGTASGPLSFIRVYDAAASVIREGGRRHAANMAVLDVSHPDIESFVAAKARPGTLSTFNLSVGVTDAFLRGAVEHRSHELVNPRTGRVVATVPAGHLFDAIVEHAWRTGEPGLLFLDRVNAADPLSSQGRIVATNPCGEVPLRAYESCNLGSIDLARFVRDGVIDGVRLDETVRLAVRFLDDVIDVSRYPEPALGLAARRSRRVGLGIMGLADLLAELGIPYDSRAATRTAGRLAARIQRVAHQASAALAEERGAFPLYPASRYARTGGPPLRNAQLTSIAPTGTISLIAGTTAGIEPLFAVAYARRVLGNVVIEVQPAFERVARDRGFLDATLLADIAATGTVRGHPAVPPEVQRNFVTALEVPARWHVRMQAAVQAHVDAAVSKTVNLPTDATPADVEAIYLDAWRAGCKGITVYRYGTRPGQVLQRIPTGTGSLPDGPAGADGPPAC
jgi:ribonucleoside-diphosphate reductase alpha chain